MSDTGRAAARSPLTEAAVERIRRERYRPRPTQPDYLHLAAIRRALAGALAAVPDDGSPALDLWCGTQPYRALVRRGTVVGVDRDRYFARASVVAGLPLPFADGAFTLALCTQALHLADDPPGAVAELRRVLAPGGHLVVTVPHLFRREIPAERRLRRAELQALFAEWQAEVRGFGGLGGGAVFAPASLALGAARRWPLLRLALAPAGLALTALGLAVDVALSPLARRWPANWLVVARRPPDGPAGPSAA